MLLALFALPLLLLACGEGIGDGPTGEDGGLGLDRPHYLILGASGHPMTVTAGHHEAYLVEQGTAGRLYDLLSADGSQVFVWDHADEFFSHDAQGNVLTPWDNAEFTSFGFLHLVEDLRWIDENWIQDRETPTRLIVLGHSHGVVWAHIALHLYPDIPVDVLIDLDGDCTAWGSDAVPGLPSDGWDQIVQQWTAVNQVEWSFEIWNACDSWSVQGLDEAFDIEDVVPASAVINLEVRSDGLILFDADPNVRLDGSLDGIVALETAEGHEEVAGRWSQSMNWVVEQLQAIYALE
jgi:hypothetical protein